MIRVSSKVGPGTYVTTGPFGGLVVLGLFCLVVGGLLSKGLPFLVLALKVLLLVVAGCILWFVAYCVREVRLQRKWDALPIEEQKRRVEATRPVQPTAAELVARYEAIKDARAAARPSSFR